MDIFNMAKISMAWPRGLKPRSSIIGEEDGFTLVEILVVITIIGLIMGLVDLASSITSASRRSRRRQSRSRASRARLISSISTPDVIPRQRRPRRSGAAPGRSDRVERPLFKEWLRPQRSLGTPLHLPLAWTARAL